jgi:NTE family protein
MTTLECGSARTGGTVFALGGGGNLGATQVGMLHALLEWGILPDAIVGTSIGALNGAFLAGHADLAGIEELTELWLSVRRNDVFPMRLPSLVRGLLGHKEFLVESLGLRSFLTRADLGYSELEDAPIPVRVVATDLATCEAVVLSEGRVIEALLASAAIPGVFPPVEVNRRLLVDGGVLANVPIEQADLLGPTRIFVLPTTHENLPVLGSNALVMIQRAMTMASRPLARAAFERVMSRTPVHVLPVPSTAGQLSLVDFRATRRLIDDAYQMATEWLRAREWGRSRAATSDLSG